VFFASGVVPSGSTLVVVGVSLSCVNIAGDNKAYSIHTSESECRRSSVGVDRSRFGGHWKGLVFCGFLPKIPCYFQLSNN